MVCIGSEAVVGACETVCVVRTAAAISTSLDISAASTVTLAPLRVVCGVDTGFAVEPERAKSGMAALELGAARGFTVVTAFPLTTPVSRIYSLG